MSTPIKVCSIFLLACLLWQCNRTGRSLTKARITQPLHIAIVPCEIIPIDQPPVWQTLPHEQGRANDQVTSVALQSVVYRELADFLDHKKRSHISLQPFTDTNNMLSAKGVSLAEAWILSSSDLASLLGVDAVLRVAIRATPKPLNALTPEDYFNSQVICPDAVSLNLNLNMRNAQLTAILQDGKTGMPLWSMGFPQPHEMRSKHQTVASAIVNRMQGAFR